MDEFRILGWGREKEDLNGKTLGEIFSRHRGDRKVSFEVETGEPPHRLRVKVDVGAQIRVRPSPTLIAEVEQLVGAGSVELR